MKFMKMKGLVAALALSSLVLVSCDEESTTEPTVDYPVPTAPANLRVAVVDGTKLQLRWDKSTSEDSTWFDGYELSITGGDPIAAKTIAKTQPYEITGLVAGTEYTITLKAKNKENELSTGASVKWAPALRFTDIKLYGFESKNPSGLTLWDATTKAPKGLTATDKAKWHFGFDDRNNKLVFGSASEINIGTATPTATAEISSSFYEADDMNIVFEKVAFNDPSYDFSSMSIDLKSLNLTTGVILVVRVKEQGSSNWNYAKIFIKRSANGFYDTDHITMDISYQTAANVPYAKVSE